MRRSVLRVALRRLRRTVLLTLIARDATGRAELAEVVATMTSLAELTVQSAVAAHGARTGEPIMECRSVLTACRRTCSSSAWASWAARELNVSSDIDLIFVYDEDGETDGANARRRISNHEFFAQLGRRVIALLNDVTADGFVFRVDMRCGPMAPPDRLRFPTRCSRNT